MAPSRITVVDDSPDILILFEELLGSRAAVTTLRPPVTHADIEASAPDLLIIDLRLGTDHLPGWEIVRHLRAHPYLDTLPIIVCSGALEHVRDHGHVDVGSGATFLLPKPFSLADLDSVLAEAGAGAAVGPSSAPLPAPIGGFGEDPHGWFDRMAGLIGSPGWRQVVRTTPPASWTPADGRGWRLVITTQGLEVRPELMNPFLWTGDQPLITALGLGDDVRVELSTRGARWVDRFAIGTFDIAALGHAMLHERKLPHDNLPRLFPPREHATVGGGTTALPVGQERPAGLVRA